MTRCDYVIRTATAEDAIAFYGGAAPFSFRGLAVEIGGQVLALMGVYVTEGRRVAFSEMKDAIRSHKKILVRAVHAMVRFLDEQVGPIYAVASPKEPTAPYLLVRTGFKPTGHIGPLGEVMVRENQWRR